jgi:hypothetical protein
MLGTALPGKPDLQPVQGLHSLPPVFDSPRITGQVGHVGRYSRGRRPYYAGQTQKIGIKVEPPNLIPASHHLFNIEASSEKRD